MTAFATASDDRRRFAAVRTTFFVLVCVMACAGALDAQERKVPSDSTRITIPGCAKGRTFIVAATAEHEPGRTNVQPGRRFRLSGPKPLLEEIKTREGTMIEVTGLVRKSQLDPPQGVNLGGGIRIGAGPPRDPTADVRRDPGYYEVVLDLESWQPLPGNCPAR
jgi:hypothetical protein